MTDTPTPDQQIDELLSDPQRYYIRDADGDFVEYDMIAGLQLLKPDIKMLVLKERKAENEACQRIIKSKWGTNDQLWDMEDRIKNLETELKALQGKEELEG